jgi:class 3 adenylate cyclase
MEADRGDCQTKFGAQDLANDFELGQGVNYKTVVLSKISKFVNRIMDWFGLVSEIQRPKVGHK